MDIKEVLLLWFINFWIITQTNYQKIFKRKVYSSSKDSIWVADFADMQLISKFNKGIKFSLCVIDIFNKYAWVIPLKDKKLLLMLFKKYQMIRKEN